MNDPFTMVYTALYDMLMEREDFKELIRIGNQIRFDSDTDRDPIKENVSSNDLPEVALLVMNATEVNIHSTSSTSMITRQYGWYVATGDLRLGEYLSPIEWAIYSGMLGWQTKITALQWCGKSFVKRVNFVDVTVGFTDIEANRGIRGWSSIWNCEVEMHFNTKDLQDGCP